MPKPKSTKPLPGPILTAFQRLQIRGYETIKSESDLFAVAGGLIGGKFQYDRWHIFETTDWCDNRPPSPSTTATFGIGGRDTAAVLLVALRADRQIVEGRPSSGLRCTYQMVLEVEHPLSTSCVAWVDAETGDVHKTKPWLRAEEDSLKVLNRDQLQGEACIVCGGDEGLAGMYPFGRAPKSAPGGFCCYRCSHPGDAMLKRWLANSTAVESEVAA